MKKLVFAFAAVVAVSFAQAAPVDTDSIEEVVDSVVEDSVVADSVVADSTVAE